MAKNKLNLLNYWAYLVLDGLDDLVVGGEDDGDRDNETECVDVGHVGDVVHRVPTGTVPFHSTTEISKEIKLYTSPVYPLKFLSWEDRGHFLNKLSVMDHVSTLYIPRLMRFIFLVDKMEGNRMLI